MITTSTAIENERMIQSILQEREGGEREVDTPVGQVDLLTDDQVIEIKHVSDWKEGVKVSVYAVFFPDREPRLHLFGGYSKDTKAIVEDVCQKLAIAVTRERNPF